MVAQARLRPPMVIRQLGELDNKQIVSLGFESVPWIIVSFLKKHTDSYILRAL